MICYGHIDPFGLTWRWRASFRRENPGMVHLRYLCRMHETHGVQISTFVVQGATIPREY